MAAENVGTQSKNQSSVSISEGKKIEKNIYISVFIYIYTYTFCHMQSSIRDRSGLKMLVFDILADFNL